MCHCLSDKGVKRWKEQQSVDYMSQTLSKLQSSNQNTWTYNETYGYIYTNMRERSSPYHWH